MSMYSNSVSGPPSNLDEAFAKFFSNLELRERQQELVQERHAAIRARITEKAPFAIENTLLYGSYDRSTQIRPLPKDEWALDVDVFVILANKKADIDKYYHCSDGGAKLLNDLEYSFDEFQGLPIKQECPAVTVKWQTPKMKVEVTPGFRIEKGFYIPSGGDFYTGPWIQTDPFGDSKSLTARNILTDGDLVPFVKAMKCWNRHQGKILRSFVVENAAYHSVGTTFTDMEREIKTFFKYLLDNNNRVIATMSGNGEPVKIDITWHDQKIRDSYYRVERAYQLDRQGKGREAIEELAKVFGKPFSYATPYTFLEELF